MNIESIIIKIQLFEELVIESGFKRDLIDFIQSIQQPHNRNLVFMKDLSEKIILSFNDFENNSMGSELELVLKESEPFTYKNTHQKLLELNSDNEIDGNQYFQKFNSILNELNQSIDVNKSEIESINEIFTKYVTDKGEYDAESEQALMSIIFKDLQSTKSLKEFSRVLNRWNRTLLIYYTLLKSESPDEISLVEIQNGSIDVILNIDFDIAIELTELITVGLKVYSAYLLYKSKKAREIIDSYMGNKKLIAMEEKRENLMLDNIKESIKQKALEQHREKLKIDKKIEKTGVNKKAEEVSSVLTDHIIKGNEVKLLTPPAVDEENKEKDIATKLREDTAIVRERFKKLNQKDKQLLLDKYSIKDIE